MTSKTTTKASSPKTSKKTSEPQSRTKHSRRKSNRINRQRRLQKQLQILLLERHSRRCIICHHPEREAIEEEFVHWRAPWKLAQDYKLADYRTIYRHARAAGLLLQRRERLHSALDAFVESVDDVTFTGDTILRAMRAYSCIDDRGRWTEIPTQVQFSTSTDPHPPQPSPHGSNIDSNVIDIDADDESEEGEDNMLEERVTALRACSKSMSRREPAASSRSMSQSDNTACLPRASRGATPPAQAVNAREDDYADPEDDDEPDDDVDENSNGDRDDQSEEDEDNVLEERITACADSPAQALPRDVVRGQNPNDRSPSDRTGSASTRKNAARHTARPNRSSGQQETGRGATATACLPRASRGADSPAQALPRDVDRGQNPNHRSPSDRTACLPRASRGAASPAQALPRDVLRGQNPNHRSLSDRTDCLPRASRGAAIPPQPPAHSTSSKPMSRCDTTACAASPAQTASALALNSNHHGRSMTATACADSPAQALPRDVLRGQIPNDRSLSDSTDCISTRKNAARHAAHPNRSSGQQETGRGATATACLPRASRGADSPAQTASAVALNSNNCGRSMTATACADSPAQALPRDVDRGQIPNDRSPSDRTDGVALPAQPPAPQKPEPDADGLIWHPRPGYPNQEISEPDAKGRVLYKIYITAPAPPPPPRETDAQRAAELIYRSAIKKCGNP